MQIKQQQQQKEEEELLFEIMNQNIKYSYLEKKPIIFNKPIAQPLFVLPNKNKKKYTFNFTFISMIKSNYIKSFRYKVLLKDSTNKQTHKYIYIRCSYGFIQFSIFHFLPLFLMHDANCN